VQEFIQDIIASISVMFASMYEGAPLMWGSKYPVFLLELLLMIIVLDLIIFGWRPLVKRYAPNSYSTVDYVLSQVFNIAGILVLVFVDILLGVEMGTTWGQWLGISGVVWFTAAIIAVIFLGRFATTRKFMGHK